MEITNAMIFASILHKLTYFDVSDILIENTMIVLQKIDPKTNHEWIFGLHLVERDKECISVEWPNKSIFICIYDDSIVIDKTTIKNDIVTHNEKEFNIIEIKEIDLILFLNKLV